MNEPTPCEHDTLGCRDRTPHAEHTKVGDGRPCCGWPPACEQPTPADVIPRDLLDVIESASPGTPRLTCLHIAGRLVAAGFGPVRAVEADQAEAAVADILTELQDWGLALLAEHERRVCDVHGPVVPSKNTGQSIVQYAERLRDALGDAGRERALWEESSVNWQTLHNQAHDRAKEAEAERDKAHEKGYWVGYREGKGEAETRDLSFDELTDRAAQAEAREKALRESVEALIEEWESPRPKVQGTPEDAAAVLRALLATSPDREDGEVKRAESTRTSGEPIDLLAALQKSITAAKSTGTSPDREDGAS